MYVICRVNDENARTLDPDSGATVIVVRNILFDQFV